MKFRSLVIGWTLFCLALGLSLLGFAIWVIIKILAHFGVI
jgi:hypothetical protein